MLLHQSGNSKIKGFGPFILYLKIYGRTVIIIFLNFYKIIDFDYHKGYNNSVMEISKLEKPSVVIANGVAYLGKVVEKDNKITIENAFPLGTPKEIKANDLMDYMETAYSEKLTKLTVGGTSSWTCVELDEDLSISWDVAKLNLTRAIKLGPITCVIDAFNKMR